MLPAFRVVDCATGMAAMKAFDRLIASIDCDDSSQMRVYVRNRGVRPLVYVEEWLQMRPGFWEESEHDGLLLTPDEALSLAAFLQIAVGAIKQEGGRE
jgi:hypothetical protein